MYMCTGVYRPRVSLGLAVAVLVLMLSCFV